MTQRWEPESPDEDPWSNTVPAPEGLSLPARPLLLLLHLR